MRPNVIQDERSDHEDQTVGTRYSSHCKRLRLLPKLHPNRRYSQTYGAVYNRFWWQQRRSGVPPRPRSQHKKAVDDRIRRSGSLTPKRRQQLDTLVLAIYKHTALMKQALLTAAHSQLIDPAFLKKLAAVNDSLKVVAVKIKTYNENNKEHGTKQFQQRVRFELVAARKQLEYLCRLLTLERAEL